MPKNHFITTTIKIFVDYITTVFLFSLFSISILLLAKQETARTWLIVYSLVWFLMLMMMIYSRMKQVAQKEVVPQYNLNPYPLKGFVYGAAAMIPNFIVAILNSTITLNSEVWVKRKTLAVKIFFAPLHAFVELTGDTIFSFYIVCIIVPIISAAGYIAGHYGIYPLSRFTGRGGK